MDYNPLDFVVRTLSGRLPDADFAYDEYAASPATATGELPRDLSGRFANRLSAAPNPRAAEFVPQQSGPKPKVNSRHDLETLMKGGHHISLREGVTSSFSKPQLASAILFEVTKAESDLQGATELRYLPLVETGTARTLSVLRSARSPQTQGPYWGVASSRSSSVSSAASAGQTPTAPLSKDRPLDILPGTKRYIDRARAHRSFNIAPTAGLGAASNGILSERTMPMMPSCQWPSGEVPVEIFEMITQSLSHRDVRNMRLVCNEFESKASPALFREVVVPFTAELYDMIEDDVSARLCNMSMTNGNGISAGISSLPGASHSYQSAEDGYYYRKSDDTAPKHGLRVFQGFGPHMNKFGIRFEVTEADLYASPSKKTNFKHVDAYHGGYEWPPPGYVRFGRLASLEKIADETPRMTAALATLVNVQEIGLCLDSGLGFLSGPDRSHHDMVFDRPAALFDEADLTKRPKSDGAEAFWSSLLQSHNSFNADARLAHERFMSCVLQTDRNGSAELPSVVDTAYDDTTLWPSVNADGMLSGASLTTPLRGVFYTTSETINTLAATPRKDLPPVIPACLTSQQKQWILETGWAQSAFLDTYILAIGDNPQVFHQITKVTISKMSSGLLSQLDRDAFWDALPSAKDVTLLVSPDWRTVCKDDAGCAITPPVAPSRAVTTFHAVVRRMAHLDEIKRLRIGYTDGGENAKGMFGRNQNLMPAPIALLDQLLRPDPQVLSFDHIEDLTLVNCWITPRSLMHLTATQTITAVSGKKLTFDSVSLTANTRAELQNSAKIFTGTAMHEFREGCWPGLINELQRLVQPFYPEIDSLSGFVHPELSEPEEEPAPYQKITFASCGYVVLPNLANTFDQSAIELGPTMIPNQFDPDPTLHGAEFFRRRAEQIRPHMLSSRDEYIGRIVPWIGSREVTMFRTWKMQVGLPEGEGEDAEYDGLPKRGTGRFWGCVQTDVPLYSVLGGGL